MTDRQFQVIRNLLSWVVVALFLLVAKSDVRIQQSELGRFVSITAFYLAVGFLVSILLRVICSLVKRFSIDTDPTTTKKD